MEKGDIAKKYEYEVVELRYGFLIRQKPKYKKIIHEYAQQGWRLAHIFSDSFAGYTYTMELIFEREI